ncbi:alpha-glucosidase [Lactobacillus acetotolerans]|uniref:Alpha-glucosidase n=2 Tax=Lactobacillus acetotolerans TaxID=1600 RepID=A0A0D6A569_9LACO|nr:glycoside hydrolase family 31 protein [Lactobacillus acetotolerans]BAQ57590.1 alpha-glucosidase [Lactobacillus acetotolerans]
MEFKQERQTFWVSNSSKKIKISVLTPEIIRIFEDHGETGNSYAIEGNKEIKTKVEVEQSKKQIIIRTAALHLKVDEDLHIDVFNEKDQPLIQDYLGKRIPLDREINSEQKKLAEEEGHQIASDQKGSQILVIKKLAQDEQFYGLGDKTGFLNKRGYEYDNWNTDNPEPHVESFTKLYKSIPFLIGMKNGLPYGLFFDNSYKSHFDLGKENSNYYFYSAVQGNLDYYVIGGKDLKEVVSNYTYLTGRVPLPQKWTLGYQQSRWSYSVSQKEVQQIADKLRENDLPCDVIHLDIDYMDGYRAFTWRKDNYQDPKKFVQKMRKEGFRIMPIIDPGVKLDKNYPIYQEGIKKGYFVKNPDGSVYVNKVWPGDAVYPDFGRKEVRDWWAKNVKYLVDIGTCGVWNDMNEPASFNGALPDDIAFSDGKQRSTHAKMHNVYGHNMDKATYEGLKKYSGKRPYVITRAAYAGTQKYSTVWTGDNQSLWGHLQMLIPQMCNLGMSGFAFAGTDIGGFGADTTSELLIRWLEAAIFSPLLRNHASVGTRAQEPWSFGQPTLEIYRKYLKLRYHLISYLYDNFYQETKTGLPIMRPLVLNFPKDRKVRTLNDEFMVGDDLLVAPVVTEGQTERAVYLPKGDWLDFWTGSEYAGNTSILVKAGLDKLPLFIEKNTILPWDESSNHIDPKKNDVITFRLFGDHGNYIHYQDDGEDFAYQNGQFNLYKITISQKNTVELTNFGYNCPYKKVVLLSENGRQEFIFDQRDKIYKLA